MSAIAEEWKSQLVRLPPSERAVLIEFLVASLKSDKSSQESELSDVD